MGEMGLDNLLKTRADLLDALWHCQNKWGFIRDQDVARCAEILSVSQVEVEGVISFYHFFHRQPSGTYTIYLNNSIISQTKGFHKIKHALEQATGARFGANDPNQMFGLFETSCIGLSDCEPSALINFHPFTNLSAQKVDHIIGLLKNGASPANICDRVSDQAQWQPRENKTIFLRSHHPGLVIEKLGKLDPEEVISQITESKLSGMGGAFFPTGKKWSICRQHPAQPKYVVCNADEGEPGTFKDRMLLSRSPGLVLDGMISCAYAIGAKFGIIYLRGEYRWLKDKIQKTIQSYQQQNFLGHHIGGIVGFNFDVKIQLGAGAYVCGEETALLNSLEGKRGEPRDKKVYPTEQGLFMLPTVVNNVETFCGAARVIELGPHFFLQTGTDSSPGTKLISISGDCTSPGIYEIEWGTTLERLLELCGATQTAFIQVGGPSGICLSINERHRKVSLDDVICGGSLMVFNRDRDLLQVLLNFTRFFKHESCGLCTPCRAGNFLVERKLESIEKGLGTASDYEDLKEWGQTIAMTSRCGLGQLSTKALTGALDRFAPYFATLIDHRIDDSIKSFPIDEAIAPYEKYRTE